MSSWISHVLHVPVYVTRCVLTTNIDQDQSFLYPMLTLKRINNQVLWFMSKVSLLKINGSEQTVVTCRGPFYLHADHFWEFVYFCFYFKENYFPDNLWLVYPDHFVFLLTRTFCVVIFLISVYISLYGSQWKVTRWVGEYSMMCLCTCRRCDLCIAHLSRNKVYVLHHRTLLQCRSEISPLWWF